MKVEKKPKAANLPKAPAKPVSSHNKKTVSKPKPKQEIAKAEEKHEAKIILEEPNRREELERVLFKGDKTKFHDRVNFRFIRAMLTRIAADADPIEVKTSYKIGKLYDPLEKRPIRVGQFVKIINDYPSLCLTAESFKLLVEFYEECRVSMESESPSTQAIAISHIVDRKHVVEVAFRSNALSKKNMKALEQVKASLLKKSNYKDKKSYKETKEAK